MGGDRGSLSDVGAARALAELAEDELGAVLAADLTRLDELVARRDELLAAFGDPPHHPAARAELEAALTTQSAVTAALGQLRDEVAAELRSLAGKRVAAGGYARAAGASSHRGELDAAG